MAGIFKMVENNIEGLLQSIADKINKLTENDISRQKQFIQRDVVLFFSFDVVNSTAYKTVNYYGWARVLNILFKNLRESVQNQIKGAEMWRVLGDEAIFIVKIRNPDELREYINKIYRIMVATIFKLKRGEFFKSDDNFNLMKLQNILSLKTAAWIAVVKNVGDISDKDLDLEEGDNIFEFYQSQEGYEIFEFLGNDIDTGFRIATQVQDGRMVLSFELAYIVSHKTESLSFLHIITYKKLKGVWKDKLYPIIWYHDPKSYLEFYQKEIDFQDSFLFDDYVESDLIREYYNNRNSIGDINFLHDSRMYTEPFYALNKILRDRGLSEKIEHIQKAISEAAFDRTKYIEKLQLHCVAVCFEIDEKKNIKILIAKRNGVREKFQDNWEFGCSKAVINKSISQIIKEEYRIDFGIEIEPILDNSRTLKEPVPIALYQVNHEGIPGKECNTDKGIITLSQIIKPYDITQFQPTAKHERLRWVSEADLPNIEKELVNTVPDLIRTLQQAFEKIKSIEGL